MLIHNTHADVITIQETKLTPKAKIPKVHNFTIVCTDKLHKLGVVLLFVSALFVPDPVKYIYICGMLSFSEMLALTHTLGFI